MFQTLKLLAPALIPSWSFFNEVRPSPRVEFRRLKTPEDISGPWEAFWPRPAHLPVSTMLRRILWNPHWNESLFVMSCAERLTVEPTQHSAQEILTRIKRALKSGGVDMSHTPFLQYRLVFIERQGAALQTHVTFISPVHDYFGDADL